MSPVDHQLPDALVPHCPRRLVEAARGLVRDGRVQGFVFFRNACSADVHRARGRPASPMAVLDESRDLTHAFCSCSATMDAPCVHLAALLLAATSGPWGPAYPWERFDKSRLHTIARRLHDRRGEPRHSRIGDGAIATYGADNAELCRVEIGHDGASALLAAYPASLHGPARVEAHVKRENVLRKITRTAQEIALARAGAPSRQQHWEASFWGRWARGAFALFGDDGASMRVRREEDRFFLFLEAPRAMVRVALTPDAVAALIEADGGRLFETAGVAIRRGTVRPSLRLSLAPDGGLRFDPVLLADESVLDRAALPRFGPFMLLADGSLATPAEAGGTTLGKSRRRPGYTGSDRLAESRCSS